MGNMKILLKMDDLLKNDVDCMLDEFLMGVEKRE